MCALFATRAENFRESGRVFNFVRHRVLRISREFCGKYHSIPFEMIYRLSVSAERVLFESRPSGIAVIPTEVYIPPCGNWYYYCTLCICVGNSDAKVFGIIYAASAAKTAQGKRDLDRVFLKPYICAFRGALFIHYSSRYTHHADARSLNLHGSPPPICISLPYRPSDF